MKLTDKDFQELELMNIPQWHKSGYKGKGIKYLELEQDTVHCEKVLKTFSVIAPEAEVCFIDEDGAGFEKHWKAVIKHKPDIIGWSIDVSDTEESRDFVDKVFALGIPTIIASCNEGREMKNQLAQYEKVISVGAVYLSKKRIY